VVILLIYILFMLIKLRSSILYYKREQAQIVFIIWLLCLGLMKENRTYLK
jgi:hypothetical protein